MPKQRTIQFALFDHQNPLKSSEWEDFFTLLPNKVGVYRFLDRTGKTLYVGKSICLRKRLISYRSKGETQMRPKIARMLHLAKTIEYKCCLSEKHALLLEDAYIKAFKPPFNRQNTEFEQYYFFRLKPNATRSNCWIMSLSMQNPASIIQDDQLVFGAFKGHKRVRQTLAALRRALFILSRPLISAYPLPTRLLKPYGVAMYEHRLTPSLLNQLIDFLTGKSFRFIRRLESKALLMHELYSDPIFFRMIDEDLKQLFDFYDRSASLLNINKSAVVAPTKIDQMAILNKWHQKEKLLSVQKELP